jgi:hypothetical protein
LGRGYELDVEQTAQLTHAAPHSCARSVARVVSCLRPNPSLAVKKRTE